MEQDAIQTSAYLKMRERAAIQKANGSGGRFGPLHIKTPKRNTKVTKRKRSITPKEEIREIKSDPEDTEKLIKRFINRNKSIDQWARMGMNAKKKEVFQNSDVKVRKRHDGTGRSTYYTKLKPPFNPSTDKTLDGIFTKRQPTSIDDVPEKTI